MLEFMRTNSLTSARHGDGFGYIRIWATPPRKLVFLDGASSPYKWYQSCHKSLQMVSEPCPELSRVCGWCSIPQGTKGAVYPCKTSWALKNLIAVFLLHVRRALPSDEERSYKAAILLQVRHVCPKQWRWSRWSICLPGV